MKMFKIILTMVCIVVIASSIQAQVNVYLSASTSAAEIVIYPNTAWGVTSHEPDDWDFTFPEAVSFYIVPQVGFSIRCCGNNNTVG